MLCQFFFFFQLLPLGATTANRLPPSHPITSILLCPTNPLHVLCHDIHEFPLLFSSSCPAWQLHCQYLLSNTSFICPLHMSKPFQPCLFNFVSKLPNLSSLCDRLISNLVHSGATYPAPSQTL